jgi:hypothetical protein
MEQQGTSSQKITTTLLTGPAGKKAESSMTVAARKSPYNDPFSFFKAVIRKEIMMDGKDLSSLAINMVVMEILDAAKRSAREGKTIYLPTAH